MNDANEAKDTIVYEVILDEKLNEEEANKKETQTKPYHFKPTKTKSFVNKTTSQTDFNSMSHEQLVIECKRLQNHVTQLKNLINKSDKNELNDTNGKINTKKKYKERPFDFTKFNKRHILLKFAYLGWNYQVV